MTVEGDGDGKSVAQGGVGDGLKEHALVAEVDTAADMGRRGKELVARRFQWDSIVLDLQEVYSGIIANYPENR